MLDLVWDHLNILQIKDSRDPPQQVDSPTRSINKGETPFRLTDSQRHPGQSYPRPQVPDLTGFLEPLGHYQRIANMAIIHPTSLSGPKATGCSRFGDQPLSKGLQGSYLLQIEVDPRPLPTLQPDIPMFHVKQKVARRSFLGYFLGLARGLLLFRVVSRGALSLCGQNDESSRRFTLGV